MLIYKMLFERCKMESQFVLRVCRVRVCDYLEYYVTVFDYYFTEETVSPVMVVMDNKDSQNKRS